MNSIDLGKRYERLLFLSGILSILCISILLIAIALTSQDEKYLAKCIQVASKTIIKNEELLQKEWKEYENLKKQKININFYVSTLKSIWISPGIDSGCYESINIYFNKFADFEPKTILEKLNIEFIKLQESPIKFKGIEINNRAKISILGAEINIAVETLILTIQAGIAPVILLWLGSLYNTRFRETKLISKATNISQVYPHLVNIYLATELPRIKKWNKLYYLLSGEKVMGVLYSFTRLFLISFIILPVVLCYLYSLYLLPINGIIWLSFTLGVWIGITALAVMFIELMDWHFYKTFNK